MYKFFYFRVKAHQKRTFVRCKKTDRQTSQILSLSRSKWRNSQASKVLQTPWNCTAEPAFLQLQTSRLEFCWQATSRKAIKLQKMASRQHHVRRETSKNSPRPKQNIEEHMAIRISATFSGNWPGIWSTFRAFLSQPQGAGEYARCASRGQKLLASEFKQREDTV